MALILGDMLGVVGSVMSVGLMLVSMEKPASSASWGKFLISPWHRS